MATIISYFVNLIVFYYLTHLFGHITHWILHQKWAGKLHKAHMVHHVDLYPAKDYSSIKYKNPPAEHQTPQFFAVAAIPLLFLPWLLFILNIYSITLAIFCFSEILILGIFYYFIHDFFHIDNHPINKMPIINVFFKRWNQLHYLHHKKMKLNLGIFNHFFDKIMNSYWITYKYKNK